MPTRRSLVLTVGITALVLSAACASRGTPSISQVQANPGHYVDHTVIVTGTVTSAWGLPLLPYRLYRVSDGQSEITVLSSDERGRTPSRGSRVRVRGEVEEFAVLGGRSVGLHLRERSLKVL